MQIHVWDSYQSMTLTYFQVTSTALRCLIWMFKFPLPQMKKQIAHVTKSLFVLLHNYASVGAGKGDNFELVVMCFKVSCSCLSKGKLNVLLHKLQQWQI